MNQTKISMYIFLIISSAFSQDYQDYQDFLTEEYLTTSMRPMLLYAAIMSSTIEDTIDAEIVRIEMDIISEPIDSFRYLYEGLTYGIYAFSDWRVSDLDIEVFKEVDGKWMSIEKDDSSDNNPTVFIAPSATGLYRIVVTAYKFLEGYDSAHYGVIIFH